MKRKVFSATGHLSYAVLVHSSGPILQCAAIVSSLSVSNEVISEVPQELLLLIQVCALCEHVPGSVPR